MKIIINSAINYQGGGLQVALSFINECTKFSDNIYHVMMGPSLAQQVDTTLFPTNFNFYLVPKLKFWQYSAFLSRLETSITPDVVFSIFGPVYWRPKTKHVMGFALGHYIYLDSPYWTRVSFLSKLIWHLKRKIHLYYLKKDADAFVVETDDVANRLSKQLEKPCFVVSNTYSSFFENYLNNGKNDEMSFLPSKKQGAFYLVSVCTPYPHKNLSVISSVLDILYSRGIRNIYFVLTVDQSSYHKIFDKKYHNNIITVGVVSPREVPHLYSSCDATFVPSLLECFTANFPESMIMNKPILASDLSFSHAICKDAALYFNPLDPVDIADKIVQLYQDKHLYDCLVQKGRERLPFFCNSFQRAKSYLNICQKIEKSHYVRF